MSENMVKSVATYPQTIYATALLYWSADGAHNRVLSHMEIVSGDNPLTFDEVISRGRKSFETMDAMNGWVFKNGSFSWLVQKQEPA